MRGDGRTKMGPMGRDQRGEGLAAELDDLQCRSFADDANHPRDRG